MKNRGFTLIELLVVIILIAAIVLLVLPNITNSVNNYNINVDKTTLNIIKQATNLYISDNTNSFMKRSENTYCISLNELIEKNYLKNTIQYNDQDITNVKVVKVTYENGFNYELVNKTSCKKVIKFDTICELKEGTDKTIGSKYNCKVDPDKALYTFYVLSYNDEDGNIIKEKENAKSINLIMDRNINSDGTPVTKYIAAATPENGVYNIVQWVSPSDYYSAGGQGIKYNSKRPITAMNFLNKATKSWENIKNLNITYDDEFGPVDGVERVKNFKVTGKARLPYYRELEMYDTETGRNAFLYDYLTDGGMQTNVIPEVKGYWTMASSSNNANGKHAAALTSTNGKVANVSAHIGVRPVINVNI